MLLLLLCINILCSHHHALQKKKWGSHKLIQWGIGNEFSPELRQTVFGVESQSHSQSLSLHWTTTTAAATYSSLSIKWTQKKINKSKSDDDYVCRWYDTSFRQFMAIYRNLPLSVSHVYTLNCRYAMQLFSYIHIQIN